MAKHNNLKELFAGIANSIRNKTGSTKPILADDFPSEIDAISTGFPNGTEWSRSNRVYTSINCVYNANGIWVAGSGGGTGLYYSIGWQPS